MTRWSSAASDHIETPGVDAFLREISEVCQKHGFCIGHEDTGGGFIISAYDGPQDLEWLNAAAVDSTVKPDKL